MFSDRLSEDRLCIFLFHGAVEHSSYAVRNYKKKHLEREELISILHDIRCKGNPLSMDDAVWHHMNNEPFPKKSFAVTFDDGFENNYSVAAPVLDEMNIPATFYVTTGFIETGEMSWTDRIEYCLEATSSGSLLLPWPEPRVPFASIVEKIALLEEIRDYVKSHPDIDPDMFATNFCTQCGVRQPNCSEDPLDKKMDWQQVSELARHDLFIVGGHSHTHAILSFLEELDLEAEIDTSLSMLKEKAGITTQHYSYPEGLAHCYSERVIQTLRRHDIVCSPTAIDGDNGLNDDLFHLRRIAVVPHIAEGAIEY